MQIVALLSVGGLVGGQLQVNGRNQPLMEGLLLVWRKAEGVHFGPDGEKEEGDGGHHLDCESFGFVDVLEVAFREVGFSRHTFQSSEMDVQVLGYGFRLLGGSAFQVEWVVAMANAAHSRLALRLALQGHLQICLRIFNLALCTGDVLVEGLRTSHWSGHLTQVAFLFCTLPEQGLFGILYCLFSLTHLRRQGGAGSFAGRLLDMEEVGGVMHTQVLFDVMTQPESFVTGALDYCDRQRIQPLIQGSAPAFRLAVRCIFFQQDVIGDRFYGH